MEFPSSPSRYEKPAADFMTVSDEDFARFSTDDKFRHLYQGMRELTRLRAELAAATNAANQEWRRDE